MAASSPATTPLWSSTVTTSFGAKTPVCAQLIRAYEEFGRPAAGGPPCLGPTSRYCSLKTTPIHDNYFFVDDMIEKPKKGQEFSNYSILGRAGPRRSMTSSPGLSPVPAAIQLTDAMAEYARNYGGMTAVEFTGKHYDMGNKLKVAEAQVELALQHPEIGEGVPRLPERVLQDAVTYQLRESKRAPIETLSRGQQLCVSVYGSRAL